MTEIKQVGDARTTSLVSALVGHGLIDPSRENEAIDVVERTLGGQRSLPTSLRRRFAELAGYVGGAFVVSAALIFFGDRWDDFSVGAQVGLLVGTTLLLGIAGLVLAFVGGGFGVLGAGRDAVRRRLAGVLFTGASGAAAFAAGVQIESSAVLDEAAFGLGISLTFLVVSTLGYVLAPTVVGQLAMAVGAVTAVPYGLTLIGGNSEGDVAMSLSILALGAIWVLLAESGIWREVATGRVVGSVIALFGAQFPMLGSDFEWVAYIATGALAVAAFMAYVARTAWPYLATGVIAVTLAVPEALLDWTDGSVGSAGALLIAGVTLLVACLLGLRLRREVNEVTEEVPA